MPATPQDHKKKPGPHVVEIKGESFDLAVPNAGLLRSVRRRDAMDLMFTLFEECGTPEFLTALDTLDMDELNEVFSDWMASLGGGDSGKSGSSSS